MNSVSLLAFLTATLVLLVIPGPAVLYIMSRSIEQGTRAGIISVAGIALGGLAHVLFAVLGLSALLAASALAFNAVKYAGAAYLIYLGITKLLEKPRTFAVQAVAKKRHSKLFWEGFVVQILNPKIGLFFLSFLPQFVAPGRGSMGLQILSLGLIFVGLAFITDLAYALAAGRFGERIRANPALPSFQKWFSGITYLSLGALAAISGSSTKAK